MAKPVNIYEAKTHLSKLVDRAAAGHEVIIAKAGRPVARLVPLAEPPRRVGGFLKGKIWIAPDFDDPLPENVLELFEGGPIEPEVPGP